MRKRLSFTTKTEKEAVSLQVAAVIPTTTYFNSSTSITPPPHLRARVPIQTIEIPAAAVVTPPPTTAAPRSSMVNNTTTAETSVSSSHSSAAAAVASSSKIAVSDPHRDGVQERSSTRSSSRHRPRSRSPFKLFRRPFQNINKLGSSTSSSSQSVPVLTSTATTSTRDEHQERHHHRMTRSVEPHTTSATATATATATPTATATAGSYEKEKLQQQLQQDYTEVTESTGTTTATSTVSERAARRQQLIVTESHPHALTTTRRSSTSGAAADVPSSTGQRKHSGTAAFMGSRSSSRRSRSSKDVADDIALGSSSLDTEEDLREQEVAAAAAAASGRSKSKSSSSSSRNRQHSSSSRNKTKKVPRVKESRIVWTKGMQQDYQQRHEAATKAAAEAAANNNDATDKSLSTITLTANTSSSKYQQQQQYKLYLLLLNPTSKIFELIQLIYAPATTTVGDILKLIPPNATEPALASQQYTGLTRPKRSSPHFMNLSMLASNSPANCLHEEGILQEDGQGQGQGQSQLTAGIGHGEIMLAIPHGFTPQHVIRLAKQILANPRIQALLHAANPLHKHGHDRQSRYHHHQRKSSSRHHSSSSDPPGGFSNGVDESSPTRTSPRDGLLRRNTMESVHEEYATQPATPVRDVPDSIKAAATAGIPIVAVTPSPMKNHALQHGYDDYYQKSTTTTHDQTTPVHSNAAGAAYSVAHHAAVSSSSLPASRDHDTNVFGGAAQQLQQQRMSLDSFIRVNNQAAAAGLQQLPLPALGGTYEEASVDMSYSSWSQSVDSSFSSLVSTSMRSSSSSLRSTGSSFRSARSINMSHNSNNNIGSGSFQQRSTTVSTTAYLTNSRRQRHVKFVKHVKGMALVTFGFMVAFYFVDPAGYAATHGGTSSSAAAAAAMARLHIKQEQPLGMCGTFQALLVMFFLVKFQLFLQVTPPSAEDGILGDEDTAEYQYKCPFLQATTVGMERLRKQLRRHRRRQLQQRTQKRY